VGRIRVLDDSLVNRIAAGEVVERPASVVKELVENSLDAGAGTVHVRLAGGGKSRIEVADDGCGMDLDDALLAVERHATSKLRRAEDLDHISTLGFRGEALASIAAVSHLTLRTADGESEGTEIAVRCGRIDSPRRAALPRGTTIQVERLFVNTPVRRTFLRSEATELAHCLRGLIRHALAHPECRFIVEQGPRRLLEATVPGDRLQRVAQLFGHDAASRVLPFEVREGGAVAGGFAGRPEDALPRRDSQHLFVNGRAVQDRTLAHAISAAYANTVPHGRHPALVLYLTLPAPAVDVNVHPQKTEVRFRDTAAVHDLVERALRSALAGAASGRRAWAGAQRGAATAATAVEEPRPPALAPSRPGTPSPACTDRPAPGLVDAMQRTDPERRHRAAVPLAQLRDSYIVAEDADGLVLVDQHAAHERVLFERFLEQAEENRVEVQELLFPLTFEVSAEQRIRLEQEVDEFRRLGFSLEGFGGEALRIDAVPSLVAGADPRALVGELLGEAGRARSALAGVSDLRRRLVTTTACHAAIKVNHPLAPEAMQALLDQLYATDNPSTCPHGRPILFRLSFGEIERAFRRR